MDDEQELAVKYRVVSIPTFLVFVGGEVKANFMGAMSAAQLKEKVEAAIQ